MTTPQLEKVYFNFILSNKKYFDIVKSYFFRNSEIQFVYGVIREYMLKGDSKVPTPRQILDMVNIEDKEGLITKEILKSILQVDLKEYDEKNFIEPNFNGWVLSNRFRARKSSFIFPRKTKPSKSKNTNGKTFAIKWMKTLRKLRKKF